MLRPVNIGGNIDHLPPAGHNVMVHSMNKNPIALHPRWIVCVDDANRVLENHALIISDDKIDDIVPWPDAHQQYANIEVIELPQQALLPGLINTHTHLAMNLLRGYADDLPLMAWLNDHIWPAEGAHVNQQFVADGTRLAIAESIQSGVTCFNDMYFFPDVVAEVAHEIGMRASIGLIALDFPTVWAQNADEYLSKGVALHRQLQSSKLISTMLAPHAPYTVSEEPLKKIAQLRDELGIGIHMHIHETQAEVEQFEEQHGMRPLAKLEKLGLLNERLCAVHVTQATDKEIEALTKHQCHVLHCPESNLKLASGIAPISAMTDAGINIAMGTDGAASNNDLDLLGETRTAGFIGKVAADNAAALPASQLLRMATINGAKALNLDKITGSIEKGKQADLISVDFNQISMQPVYDPISHLIYSANRDNIKNTWVAGKRLLKNRQLTTMDASSLIDNAHEWALKIKGNQS